MKTSTNWSEYLRDTVEQREKESPRALARHIALGTDSARCIADEIESLRREVGRLKLLFHESDREIGLLRAELAAKCLPLLAAAKATRSSLETKEEYQSVYQKLDAAIAKCEEGE